MLLLLVTQFLFVVGTSTYVETSSHEGQSFFDGFDFFTGWDPTNGVVDYVTRSDAEELGLVKVDTNGQIYMGADDTSVITSGGRKSVRISSEESYNGGLFIFDLEHMPTGCGTWPAFWLVGPNWPNQGEIDIIEGTDGEAITHTTLHVNDSTCSMDGVVDQSMFTGQWDVGLKGQDATNCASHATGQKLNGGCSILSTDPASFGSGFNAVKGGAYAMEWVADSHISMWFFRRGGAIPADVAARKPDPTSWGTPYAHFVLGHNCPSGLFKDNQLVINLTFCGDPGAMNWASENWKKTCPAVAAQHASCADFVRSSPGSFSEAYWGINSLRVYQQS